MTTPANTTEHNSKIIPNSFQVPNYFVDTCMRYLHGNEMKCVTVISRKTFGWHKSSDRISKSQLMELTGLSKETIDEVMSNLVAFGLVIRVSENDARNRGTEWALQLDSDLIDIDAMIARQQLKRNTHRQQTASARNTRLQKGGGDVQQSPLKKTSVEQKTVAGGDVEHMGGGNVQHIGGGDVQHTPQNPIKPTTQNPPSLPTSLHTDETGGREGWRFAQIAENNLLNRKSVADLRTRYPDEQERARKFLGWILYAYSAQGKGLRDASGVSNAITNLCAAEPQSPPRNFERLIKLGSQRLRELIDRDYTREDLGNSVEAQIYRSHFAHLSLERKNDLYYRLFGEDAPERAAKPNTATESVLARRLKQSRKDS